MPVPHVRVTLQIKCGNFTMLSQNKNVLSDNGEIRGRLLFLVELCIQGVK